MKARNALTFLACAAALSCGSKAIDLDAPRELSTSTDPTVLGVINELMVEIAVDDERVYWLGSWVQGSVVGSFKLPAAVHSCLKSGCAGSFITYDSGDIGHIAIRAGQLYWVHYDDWESGGWSVRTCDVAGCSGGPRSLTDSVSGRVQQIVLAGDDLYLSTYPNDEGPVLYRLSTSSSGVSLVPLAIPSQTPQALAVAGDYAYWIGEHLDSPVIAVQRALLDGSGGIEILADHLKVALRGGAALKIDSTHVYWSQGGLTGSVARCPLTGCANVNAPESIASPIRSPDALLIDGTRLYWQHDTFASNDAVSSCELAHCVITPPLITGLESPATFALDDQYLYAGTTQHPLNGDEIWADPSANIRRVPK